MKLVIDCSVLISAGWNPGVSRTAFLIAVRQHDVFVSPNIIQEYEEVTQRPKFARLKGALDEHLGILMEKASSVLTTTQPPQLPDPTDEAYLAVALTIQADAILTGNKKHFPDAPYDGVRVLSPREFLDLVGS